MSTLTQLIVETSALLGDSGGNRWLTAVANPAVLGTNDVQYLLNLAAVQHNIQSGVYRKVFPVQVTAGNPVVALLDDSGQPPFGSLLRLEDDQGKALVKTSADALNVTTSEQWKSTAPDQPKRYIRGLDGFGTVRLYPTCPRNATFLAYVVAEPIPMLTGTDLPWIGAGSNLQDSPAQYHSDLPFFAAWFALLMNKSSRDIPLAKEYAAEFEKRVARAAADVKTALEP